MLYKIRIGKYRWQQHLGCEWLSFFVLLLQIWLAPKSDQLVVLTKNRRKESLLNVRIPILVNRAYLTSCKKALGEPGEVGVRKHWYSRTTPFEGREWAYLAVSWNKGAWHDDPFASCLLVGLTTPEHLEGLEVVDCHSVVTVDFKEIVA